MTVQITYNKPSHNGNYGVRIHKETYCTNETTLLDTTRSGLQILQVLIEKFQTVIIQRG
jgi:hypothetical protein